MRKIWINGHGLNHKRQMVDEGHRLRGHDVVFGDGEQRRLLEGQTPWIF